MMRRGHHRCDATARGVNATTTATYLPRPHCRAVGMRCRPAAPQPNHTPLSHSQPSRSLRSCFGFKGNRIASSFVASSVIHPGSSSSTPSSSSPQHNPSQTNDDLPPAPSRERRLACCEAGPGAPALDVAVLVSGGVDSSVALSLLRETSHRCTAFYLKIWFEEDFDNYWGACPWEDDLAFVQSVCDAHGVALEVVPLTKDYWDKVVAHSIEEIKAGCTPNPDIMCNTKIKFGAFLRYLDETHPGRFDRVASGHYARVEDADAGASSSPSSPSHTHTHTERRAHLLASEDARKDQTYFLANLNAAQLARCMFPLGGLTKPEVRALAQDMNLPNKDRKDSQGICFLGKVNFDAFVEKHLGTQEGDLVEWESGEVVGTHRGYWFYTIGQRQGIGLAHGPWYVTGKDVATNVVYISRRYHEAKTREARNAFFCASFNWLEGPEGGGAAAACNAQALRCKVRHGPTAYPCTFTLLSSGGDGREGMGGEEARVEIEGNDHGFAPGQYAVFYDGRRCLGAAVITGTPSHTEAGGKSTKANH